MLLNLERFCSEIAVNLNFQYQMLGYYPNSNAKPRGSNLNEKMETLISWTFS